MLYCMQSEWSSISTYPVTMPETLEIALSCVRAFACPRLLRKLCVAIVYDLLLEPAGAKQRSEKRHVHHGEQCWLKKGCKGQTNGEQHTPHSLFKLEVGSW